MSGVLSSSPIFEKPKDGPVDYAEMIKQQEQRFTSLQVENERLKHFLPDSYTEMRLKMAEMENKMRQYENRLVNEENEKKMLHETIL